MPEAAAVLLVLSLCAIIYAVAVTQSRRPRTAQEHAVAQKELDVQRAWLAQRLETARREAWDADMQQRLVHQLEEIDRRLATKRTSSATAMTR